MKTLRKLLKNYIKEAELCLIVFAISLPCIGLAFGFMALPGVLIAYFNGVTNTNNLISAGLLSFGVIGLIFFIYRGISKVVKDYQRLKREDSEE